MVLKSSKVRVLSTLTFLLEFCIRLVFTLGSYLSNSYTIDMKNQKSNKKIWLINRDFQMKYAGAGLAAGLASTVITATLIIYPLFVFKILTIGMFLPWPIFTCIAAALVLNCIIQMFFGIVLTHKIAGPMYSLVKHLRLIGVGQWNIEMRQRQGDELNMVVRHFNEMSDCLVNTVKNDLRELEKIKTDAAHIESNDPKVLEARTKLLATISELEANFQQRISSQKEPNK